MQDATEADRRRTVSAAAVGRAAGVSAAAVSYAMNNKAGVAAGTRRHIMAVAEELGFKPGSSGLALASGQTRVIGLLLPNIVNPVFPRFAQGTIEAAAKEGYEVFVATTGDDPVALSQIISTLVTRNVDGVVLAATLREDATAMRALRAAKIPCVYLSRNSPYLEGDFVGIDDFVAARDIMKHLLDHGYTEIASVCGPRFSTASLTREQAFVQTAATSGLRLASDRKVSTKLDNKGGRNAARGLFSSQNPPRAVVCGSDEIAIGVMEYAVINGIRVPEDVAVTGFDGLSHSISGLIDLTTIVQPHAEMAFEAFSMLLKRIGRPSAAYQSLLCSHSINIGRTCGCVAGTDHAPAARNKISVH